MAEVVHAGWPIVEAGDDIHVPAIVFECQKCPPTKNHGRSRILFSGVLVAGSVISVKCKTCAKFTNFRGTSPA